MSKILELLNEHRDKLDPEDVSCLEMVIDKLEQSRRFAWPGGYEASNVEDHAGFAKIERVFSSTPVDLFGQEVGALSFNKMTFYRSGNGVDEPGDEIMSLHLSDQALTNLMLKSNSGRHDIPGTAVSMAGETLPAYAPSRPASDDAFNEARDKALRNLTDQFEAAAVDLLKATNIKARKTASASIASARQLLAKNSDLSFYLEQRMSTYSSRRTDLISEVSQAAFHAEHVLNSDSLLTSGKVSFDAEVSRQSNPMLNALLGNWSEEETEAVSRLVACELERIRDTYDVKISQIIHEDGSMASGRDLPSFDAGFKKDIEDIRGLVNSSMNVHVLEGRAMHRPHQLGLSMTRTQNNGGYTHSALPSRGEDMFTLSVGAAYEEMQFGESRLRGANSSIISISLTADDLMLMFRGTMSGAPVPCAISSVAGVHKNAPPPQAHELQAPIEVILTSLNQDDRKTHALALLSQAAELVESSAPKAELQALSRQIVQLMPYLVDLISEGFEAGDETIRGSVASVVQKDFGRIHKANPHLFGEIQSLISGQADPENDESLSL